MSAYSGPKAKVWTSRGPVYLDDSGLAPHEKRHRLYVLQEGKCAACRKGSKLFVDHDHCTGLVRGLLCQPCNQREGIMNSGLVRGDYPHITAYLASPPAVTFDWMWDFPAGWTFADLDRLHKIGGISALEYVRTYGLLVTLGCTP